MRVLRATRGKKGMLRHAFSRNSTFFSIVFFILSLLSKPMTVSLPVVLLILDWYPFQRIQSPKTFWTSLVAKSPFIALSIFSSVMTILAQQAVGAVAPVNVISLSTRILVAAKSLVTYLWKMIVPLNLIPFYPYPIHVSLLSLEYIVSVVLVIGITATCIVIAKKRQVWLSVWSYHVVTLLPVIGIVQVGSQAMADRYTYLPSLGPFLTIGLMTAWVSVKVDRLRQWGLVVKFAYIAATILILTTMTFF